MFGRNKYNEEYSELFEFLTEEWKFKHEYADSFLMAYKKNIGRMLSETKDRVSRMENSPDHEVSLLAIANGGQEHAQVLVAQAYYAYMLDLRAGKHGGSSVELAIWAILVNRCDLIEPIDKAFSNWIYENYTEKFPDLFDDVMERSE